MRHPVFFRYFVAIPVVNPQTRQITGVREQFGLKGYQVPDGHLHMTLCLSEDSLEPQPDLIRHMRSALDEMTLPACPIELDVVSGGRGPVVLVSRGGLPAACGLQRLVERQLVRRGVKPRKRSRFNPHVTLGYDDSISGERPVPRISWSPSEIVLIESWVGRTRHRILGRWPLGTAPDNHQHAFEF